MGRSTNADSVIKVTGLATVGLGTVATVLPKLFSRIYDISGDGTLLAMIRMWGARNVLLGVLNLIGLGRDARTLVTATTAVSALDALVIATAGSDVATSTRVKGTLTAAAFAASGAYALTAHD